MNNWGLRQFRNDLSIFIDLIERENVTGDFSGLKDILDSFEEKNLVEYNLENLSFYIKGRIAGTQPDDMNYCQIFMDNILMVKDELSQDSDPLYCYSMDINISVYKSEHSTKKCHTSSWHLDRHFNTTNVKYTHPIYHFQFGGKKLELIDEEMSILSCPRIPHPPMDIFLGFHFILSNYYNNRQFSFVNSLLQNPDYQRIIERAQGRLWSPYFDAFDLNSTHQDYSRHKLFPLYIN